MNASKKIIRKPWAVFLAFYVLSFIAGIYPYLKLGSSVSPLQLLIIFLDLSAMHGLYGYVQHKPIMSLPLRLLYLILIPIMLMRIAAVVYFIGPSLIPWIGLKEQYVPLLAMLAIPMGLLTAIALWKYSTNIQRTQYLASTNGPVTN